jgi:hypothetical protein
MRGRRSGRAAAKKAAEALGKSSQVQSTAGGARPRPRLPLPVAPLRLPPRARRRAALFFPSLSLHFTPHHNHQLRRKSCTSPRITLIAHHLCLSCNSSVLVRTGFPVFLRGWASSPSPSNQTQPSLAYPILEFCSTSIHSPLRPAQPFSHGTQAAHSFEANASFQIRRKHSSGLCRR